jgi:hypothetical protein
MIDAPVRKMLMIMFVLIKGKGGVNIFAEKLNIFRLSYNRLGST